VIYPRRVTDLPELDRRILAVADRVRAARRQLATALDERSRLVVDVRDSGVPVCQVSERVEAVLRAAGWTDPDVASVALSTGTVKAAVRTRPAED